MNKIQPPLEADLRRVKSFIDPTPGTGPKRSPDQDEVLAIRRLLRFVLMAQKHLTHLGQAVETAREQTENA